jgi:hypothetical protein
LDDLTNIKTFNEASLTRKKNKVKCFNTINEPGMIVPDQFQNRNQKQGTFSESSSANP